jgi:hypothetical protein
LKRYDSMEVRGWWSANDMVRQELAKYGSCANRQTSDEGGKARRVWGVKLKRHYTISIQFVNSYL